ncbi:hypothetical protein K461DRAFT_271301 [Myriangium duriaei CBS 260.36]|uniref:Uncharacterized protein n=1 Tax=Myriangium duriaei CBS 260.36 TaxID=1168546 RepID=A0A9P4IRE7_9PEZI|nr:hypothetical protein K461DRAFT_271301 [Myriangium duriaei CBS 260.36]
MNCTGAVPHHERHFSTPSFSPPSPQLTSTPQQPAANLPLWHRLRDPSLLTSSVAPTVSPRIIAARQAARRPSSSSSSSSSSSTTSTPSGSAQSSPAGSPLSAPEVVQQAGSYFPACMAQASAREGGLSLRPVGERRGSLLRIESGEMEVMRVGWWRGEFW